MLNDADENAVACDRYARTLEKCTEVAVWQLALAMRESDGAVERLGCAIERMSITQPAIEAMRARLAMQATDPATTADIDGCMQRMLEDLAACVENIQFYDRMVQHLGHLKHYLASISGVHAAPGTPRAEIAALELANSQFRRRLLTDAQRSVFDHVFRPDNQDELESLAERAARASNAAEGTIEFF
ncbi:MAG: hypothetical protein AB7P31_13335 [Steroidobacteraceae bacterium]